MTVPETAAILARYMHIIYSDDRPIADKLRYCYHYTLQHDGRGRHVLEYNGTELAGTEMFSH
jgi:hypothetical protein